MITYLRNMVYFLILILLIGVITIPSKVSFEKLNFDKKIESVKLTQIKIEIQDNSMGQNDIKIAKNDLAKKFIENNLININNEK